MSKIKVNSIEAATGSTITIPSGQTLDISATTLTLPSTVVTTTGTQTLTNKTIGVSQLSGTIPTTIGGTGLTTLGTAAQVLRVNSGATALEFATPAVATSDFVQLASATAAGTATSVSFDGYFSSTYTVYLITASSVYGSSIANLHYRYMRSGSEVTASNHRQLANNVYGSAATDHQTLTTNTSFELALGGTIPANTPTTSASFQLFLHDPLATDNYKTTNFQGFFQRESSSLDYTISSFCQLRDNANALSGIKIYVSAGNIYGKFKLYGLK